MSQEPILIYYVEDDVNIRDLTVYALEQAGFKTEGFPGAQEFLDACDVQVPKLILLDIMLPETNGIEILKLLRSHERFKHIPVMMLTAKGTEFDTVSGLNAGADDYLAKPFGMMELIARVNALLRRIDEKDPPASEGRLRGGSLVLNTHAYSVTVEGHSLDLTLKEFELLKALMQNSGMVLSRDQLLRDVWGIEFLTAEETRTVDVHIQTLRQKISQLVPGEESHIRTVRGVGYCFENTLERDK